MSKFKIGMVTIGQTPREDLVEGLKRVVGSDVEVVIYGAFDALNRIEIEKLDRKGKDQVLVMKLADGATLNVPKRHVSSRIQKCIDRLQDEDIELIVIACTGKFPKFKSKKLILEPSVLLHNIVSGLVIEGKLGLLIPTSEQIEDAYKKWSRKGVAVYAEVASPWKEEELVRASDRMKRFGVDLVVLDCYGYTKKVKENVGKVTGRPVLAACTITARLVKELLC